MIRCSYLIVATDRNNLILVQKNYGTPESLVLHAPHETTNIERGTWCSLSPASLRVVNDADKACHLFHNNFVPGTR